MVLSTKVPLIFKDMILYCANSMSTPCQVNSFNLSLSSLFVVLSEVVIPKLQLIVKNLWVLSICYIYHED